MRLLICLTVVDVVDTALAAGYGGRGRGGATLGGQPYLLSPHVDQQLCAIGAEGDIGGNQHSQTVVVVGQLHWQVTCREQLPECEASSPSQKAQGVVRSQPSQ